MNGVSRRRTSGSQSPLNTELAAYGDAFALKRRLKLVEREEGKVGDEDPEDEEAPISPTFIMAGGAGGAGALVHGICVSWSHCRLNL